jgi:hypothetical protein
MKSRNEMVASLFQGVGAEIGVAGGWFSNLILRDCPRVEMLYSVDPYSRPINEPLDSAHTSTIELYNEAKERLAMWRERSAIVVMTSAEAVSHFENGGLDFVYIDADHNYSSVKQDIQMWYPKVKTGGVFSGHDYSLNCPGVIRAVDEFRTEHPDLEFQTTEQDEMNGEFIIGSWCFVK